jgi:acetyl esterase/lipase
MPLWPNGAPGAKGAQPEDIPTISLYRPPAGKANGAAIVVCPGGGYGHLADHEGHTIAVWLNNFGITAAVLKYRLGPRYNHPSPMQDATRAMRTVRARSKEWNLDANRIGIWGFSAGGHLAATIATHFDGGDSNATDPIERISSRPDIAVLAYPVISMNEAITHAGSRKNLLGDNPSPELVELLSNEKQVTSQTPPTFLFHTADDTVVRVENSLLFVEGLRKAKIPYELHVFEKGPHGVGLAQNNPALNVWPKLLENWLRVRGFIK